MLRWFEVDGERIEVEEALRTGKLNYRYPKAYLEVVADRRDWKGKPSVTQLIKGTREAFLEIIVPYAVDPDDAAFMFHGSMTHSQLEDASVAEEDLPEIAMMDFDITGIADMVEQQPNGENWLIDYKTWGSFAVAKNIGIVKKKRPMYDADGNPVLYKRNGKGYKAGEHRQEDYFEVDPEQADNRDVALQLNMYKILLERTRGIQIDKLRVFCIIRDGGTHTARSYGITTRTGFIEIPTLPAEKILSWFKHRAELLIEAVNGYHEMQKEAGKEKALIEWTPNLCSRHERWDNRKCEKYCSVRIRCEELRKKRGESLWHE
jgi:hypothetical protein